MNRANLSMAIKTTIVTLAMCTACVSVTLLPTSTAAPIIETTVAPTFTITPTTIVAQTTEPATTSTAQTSPPSTSTPTIPPTATPILVPLPTPAYPQPPFPPSPYTIFFDQWSCDEETCTPEIWKMGIYGEDQELVFRDVRQREMINEEYGIKNIFTFAFPTLSPDRTALVFGYYVSNPISTGFCESSSIWVVNTDGSNPRELFHTDNGCAIPHRWSPDGSRLLAFLGKYPGDYSFVIDVASGEVTTIAEKDAGGSWSPDGKQIVLPIWNGGWPDKMGLYIVNADGSQPHMIWSAKQVPGDWSGLGNVEWSPDGTKIVFEAYRDVNQVRECYTISPDGTDLTMLVSGCYKPRWSPDGKSLAILVWNDAENVDILYVVDHMGELKPIQRVFEPALWSFDGKALLTVSVGSIEIFEEGRSRRTAGDTLVIFPEEGRILKVPGIERKAPTISMTW